MQEFFTWTMLATYAGAVLCTTLITQLLKEVAFFARIPTRIFSYLVAVLVLLAASVFTGSLTPESGVLCAINGVVVSLAGNGAFDAAKREQG